MHAPDQHPLTKLHDEWLPAVDFAVMAQGFLPHGRDYVVIVQLANICTHPGTYELTFTHVVELRYHTRVRDDVWPESWDDRFTDYKQWMASGEPDGYVWGTNWSLAYPGTKAISESSLAESWSKRIGQKFFEATLETDRFSLGL